MFFLRIVFSTQPLERVLCCSSLHWGVACVYITVRADVRAIMMGSLTDGASKVKHVQQSAHRKVDLIPFYKQGVYGSKPGLHLASGLLGRQGQHIYISIYIPVNVWPTRGSNFWGPRRVIVQVRHGEARDFFLNAHHRGWWDSNSRPKTHVLSSTPFGKALIVRLGYW